MTGHGGGTPAAFRGRMDAARTVLHVFCSTVGVRKFRQLPPVFFLLQRVLTLLPDSPSARTTGFAMRIVRRKRPPSHARPESSTLGSRGVVVPSRQVSPWPSAATRPHPRPHPRPQPGPVRAAMSGHALPPVSFFPTAKELSSGIQWVKDHPVLAAAAATAVSVITYLNAAGPEAQDGPVHGATDAGRPSARASAATAASVADRPLKSAVRSPLPPDAEGASGKLSAAVSWCDEHGGSLTQVFQEDAAADAAADEATDADDADDADAVDLDRPLVRRRGLRKSVTAARLLYEAAAAGPQEPEPPADPLAESPQWGWYVPITPPQDAFLAQLPRAMAAGRD